jgi:hypothetical protein
MDRDFTLATELTEEDVGGDMHIARRSAGETGAPGSGRSLNLQAATNGGLGLFVACLAIWAMYRLFPGDVRDARQAPAHANQPEAGSTGQSAQQTSRPISDEVTVEMGANGIVIKPRQAAAPSAPASGAPKPAGRAVPPAKQPGTQPAHGTANAPAPASDDTQ